jgi:hypothetical protein
MNRTVALVAVFLGLLASVAAQSNVTYRKNIGKTAFNATNGVEIGKIIDVAQVNGVWVYKVNRDGRIINSPVDNVVVKDVSSTVAEGPSSRAAGGNN